MQLNENMTGGAEDGLMEDQTCNLAIEGLMTWNFGLVIPRT